MTRFLTALLAAGLIPAVANAEARRPTKAAAARPAVTATQIQEAASRLTDPNVDTVIAAIRQLGESASGAAVPPLVNLLRSGPPDAVTQAALEALGALSDRESVDILVEYANHRRPQVRVVALQAMSSIRDRRVEAALMEALRDSDPDVRATAAQALGDGGITEAVSVLFQAFDRGVVEACAAIGKLGDREAAERMVGLLGREDLPTLLEGLGEFMRRTNFDVEAKRMIVERLLDLAGPQVREFLVTTLAEMPDVPANRQLRRDIEAAIARIPEE